MLRSAVQIYEQIRAKRQQLSNTESGRCQNKIVRKSYRLLQLSQTVSLWHLQAKLLRRGRSHHAAMQEHVRTCAQEVRSAHAETRHEMV